MCEIIVSNLPQWNISYVTFINKIYLIDKSTVWQTARQVSGVVFCCISAAGVYSRAHRGIQSPVFIQTLAGSGVIKPQLLFFKSRSQLLWGAECLQSAAPIGALDRGKRDGVLVGGPSPHQCAVCECHCHYFRKHYQINSMLNQTVRCCYDLISYMEKLGAVKLWRVYVSC